MKILNKEILIRILLIILFIMSIGITTLLYNHMTKPTKWSIVQHRKNGEWKYYIYKNDHFRYYLKDLPAAKARLEELKHPELYTKEVTP